MACADQFSGAGWCHTDPEFLCFDLSWDAKFHGVVSGNEFGGILPRPVGAKKVKAAFSIPKKSAFNIKNSLLRLI